MSPEDAWKVLRGYRRDDELDGQESSAGSIGQAGRSIGLGRPSRWRRPSTATVAPDAASGSTAGTSAWCSTMRASCCIRSADRPQ